MKALKFLAPVLAACAFLAGRADVAAQTTDVAHDDNEVALEADGSDWLDGVRVIRDVPYGTDARQRFDVYVPERLVGPAPVIFMVHGGGWRRGDKAMARVVENKVARWVPKGFILVSTNYRMLPDTDPVAQAEDVARALAKAQRLVPVWGGEASKFILMGHSAGAHLVDLLGAAPWRAQAQGAQPWLGTVSLDSGAINVVDVMTEPHFPLYDDAFGSDPAYWHRASPHHQLMPGSAPFLLVHMTAREQEAKSTQKFLLKARVLGVRAEALPLDLTHGEINSLLGLPGEYTESVEDFLASLDPLVRWRLGGR